MAKVLVFGAAVDAGLEGLVIVAVLASVVAAFFYVRVIALAYMEEPEEEEPVRTGPGPGWALAVAAVVTVALGVFPSLLLGPLQTAGVLRW
jgi:NADH-quinone oxidoreductase subunit N